MLLDVDDDCQFCLECENETIKDRKEEKVLGATIDNFATLL